MSTLTLAPNPASELNDTKLGRLDRRVYMLAAAVFALLMAFSTRYGFDRDELYFMDCARHLSLSYVDQPVLTPLITRLSLSLFGVSMTGLRLWPSLAAAGTIVIGGQLAREFGGGRTAQFLTAIGVASAPVLLGADHIMGPTSFDLLAWGAQALLVVRIGRTGNDRLWIPAGLVLGLGLANKHSIGFFALALLIGILASGGRQQLRNRWALYGLLIAVVCTFPDLWWQAHHGWATIDMSRSLASENGGLKNAILFIPGQAVMAAPVLIWVWFSGLRWLWRSDRPLWRGLSWSYGLLFVFFAATAGAKPYYLGGAYIFLFAAGAVSVEAWVNEVCTRLRATVMATGLSFLITLSFVLPVLPPENIGWIHTLNTTPAESVGWPQLVGTVSKVWHGLPSDTRSKAVIFTSNYGEAGALNELGREDGLPEAVSGHNSLWFWGLGNPRATTVVAVVLGEYDSSFYDQYLRPYFGHIVTAAGLSNAQHVANQEAGGHVYICTEPIESWGSLWIHMRHFE